MSDSTHHLRRAHPGRRTLGLDRLLVRAALDPRFRARLLEDRTAAIREAGIRLTPLEERIVIGTPAAALDAMVAAAVPGTDRRGFLRAVSATVAALVAAGAACHEGPGGLPDGHVGGDPWMIPDTVSHDGCRPDVALPCDVGDPGSYWIEGWYRPVLVYLPVGIERGREHPWCLVHHGEDQTCLDAVSAFQRCADDAGVILVAPAWEGLAAHAEAAALRIPNLLEWLQYTLDCLVPVPRLRVVAGVGTGASVALVAGVLGWDYCPPAIALCGPRYTDWRTRTLVPSGERAVYLGARADTDAHREYQALAGKLVAMGERALCVALDGCPGIRSKDTLEAWRWIAARQGPSL